MDLVPTMLQQGGTTSSCSSASHPMEARKNGERKGTLQKHLFLKFVLNLLKQESQKLALCSVICGRKVLSIGLLICLLLELRSAQSLYLLGLSGMVTAIIKVTNTMTYLEKTDLEEFM